RVDDLELFLDADREGGPLHHALTGAAASPRIFSGQFPVSSIGRGFSARSMRSSATDLSTQSKFSRPTEKRSQSGAGFMKSIAYGIPSRTANSIVFMSYPSARHKVRQSLSMRRRSFGSAGSA